jgi:hemolysin activation/secretion protein
MRGIAATILLAGPAAIVSPLVALAQTSPQVPPAPTREEIQRVPVTPPAQGDARVTVSGDIERAPCPLAAPEYSAITVTLSGVEFSGLGVIPQGLVTASYSDLIGKTVPIASVCEIRDRAATALRRAGYLAAVQVPPQTIDNGIVKFDVLVAKLVGFQVRGQAGKAEAIIQRTLESIRNEPVFNILTAERYLLLARDLPGYDVRMTLRPAGTVPGEVIGEVQVLRTPVELTLNVQNLGSREVGRFGGIAQLHLNGLLGLGDRTTLAYFTTSDFEEQQVAQASEEIRIGSEGLAIGADVAFAWTRPGLDPGIVLRSHTLTATLRARYPLIRRQSRNLFASGGFDYVDQSSTFGSLPLTQDHLRVGFLRLDYDSIDPGSIASTEGYSPAEPHWRFGGSLEVRQGINIFGATQPCGVTFAACTGPGVVPPGRLTANPTAFVVRAAASFEYRPVPLLSFVLQPRVQYSPSTLLSYEQFSAGNYTVGRGFDPGTLIGDSGAGVHGEIAYGSTVPATRKDLAIQGYAFIDGAWVWNHDFTPGVRDPQKLTSAGGGVRAAFGDRFQLDAGVATPFRAAGLQLVRGDTRVLVSLTVKLLPWRR